MEQINNPKDSKDQNDSEDPKEIKIQQYIDSFNEKEKIAYNIAKTRLKTSFDIEKSIGFKSFS